MDHLPPDQYALNKLIRRHDPETSFEAAAKVLPRLSEIQEKILLFIQANPDGVTDLDISRHFEDDGSTFRSRRSELVVQGRIKNSGHTKIQNGSRRTIWEYVI